MAKRLLSSQSECMKLLSQISVSLIPYSVCPDRLFRRIIVNYGNLKSRMIVLWFWYNNFDNLPFIAMLI